MANNGIALSAGMVLHGTEYSYRIGKVLGQGSFGITYLAYVKMEGKLGAIDTPVAIKEFFMKDVNGRNGSIVTTSNSGGIFDRYREKFVREAQTLSSMNHPGIVNVLETFQVNGTSYFSMEYCDGGSLDDKIALNGALPEAEALQLFAQIAAALQFMHDGNMLHLDLKPGNVMLRNSGETVLIDFGLSKVYNQDGEPESSTTIGGGTPGYAPIEQSSFNGSGNNGTVPVTMDIYALGGTLFKMLTGQRPPVSSDVLAAFPLQPLLDHNVSQRTIDGIRKAMAPVPANRYQSVAEFAAALGIALVKGQDDDDDDDDDEKTVIDDEKKVKQLAAKVQQLEAQLAQAHQQLQNRPPVPPPAPVKKIKAKRWAWIMGIAAAVLLLFGIVMTAVAISLSNDNSYYWSEYIDASTSLDAEREKFTSTIDAMIGTSSPIVVSDVCLWNDGDSRGSTIYSSSSTYIYHAATFTTNKTIEDATIYVKFYAPYGLSTGSESPSGYSYKFTTSLQPYVPWEVTSNGWGGKDTGHWASGNYRVEFWYEGECIGATCFKVK